MTSVAEQYRTLVLDHRFEFDPAQSAVADRLDALCAKLRDYRVEAKPSALARFMGIKPAEAPRGLYVHGSVGRGKTMLMDLFFAAADVPRKRRDALPRLHGGRARPTAPVAAGAQAGRSVGRRPDRPDRGGNRARGLAPLLR